MSGKRPKSIVDKKPQTGNLYRSPGKIGYFTLYALLDNWSFVARFRAEAAFACPERMQGRAPNGIYGNVLLHRFYNTKHKTLSLS
jgi:hypothetical protein